MIRYNKSAINLNTVIAPPKMGVRPIKQDQTASVTDNNADLLINKAVEEVSLELELKYKSEIDNLSSNLKSKDLIISELQIEVTKLKSSLEVKEQTIKELISQVGIALAQTGTNNTNYSTTVSNTSSNVIEMEEIFVDPSVKGQEDKMTGYLNITEIKSDSNVLDNVSKLKKALKRF